MNGKVALANPQKELNIKFVAIEDTLADGVFHSKKMGTQLSDLCLKIGQKPENVLLLDDTPEVCQIALVQGLTITDQPIAGPKETKQILRGFINE